MESKRGEKEKQRRANTYPDQGTKYFFRFIVLIGKVNLQRGKVAAIGPALAAHMGCWCHS